MRVVHVVPYLTVGGVELHLLTLCKHLKNCGHDPILVCLQAEYNDGARLLKKDFEALAIDVYDLKANGYWDLTAYARFLTLIRNLRPDIIHTHLPWADFGGSAGALLAPAIPLICSVHDIYSNSWSGKWALPLFNLIWRRADLVIAISHAVKDWLIEERKISPHKVKVIHYGIEPERFIQPTSGLQKSWGLDGRAVIGSVGRLEPRKGHEYLIRAMPAILKQVPNASLRIAGHDPWGYGEKLQTLIADLGLNNQVQLVGFQGDVSLFLHSLDVFAFASSSEGFGQVVIEAMAAGKPVVASRIPPITEIVLDGETGLLAEPENPAAFARAICWLLMRPDEARQMGSRGKERIYSRFTAEQMSAATLSLYRELVS